MDVYILKDIIFALLFLVTSSFIVTTAIRIKEEEEKSSFVWIFIKPFLIAIASLIILTTLDNIFINLSLCAERIFIISGYLALDTFLLFHFAKFYRVPHRSTLFFLISILITIVLGLSSYFGPQIAYLMIKALSVITLSILCFIILKYNNSKNKLVLFSIGALIALQDFVVLLSKHSFINADCITIKSIINFLTIFPIFILSYRNIKRIKDARRKKKNN